ncbi:MAG: hypothetical protein ACTJGG_12600 [Marinomonas foliarum]
MNLTLRSNTVLIHNESLLFSSHSQVKAVKFGKLSQENKFSLAGVQMKFSMKEKDGRYNLSKDNGLGD